SVGLGIFVVAQAIFLPVANGLEFLPQLRSLLKETIWARKWASDWINKKDEVYEAGKKADQLSQRWQELTGQPQRWSLFAPEVADDIWFLGITVNQTESNQSSAPLPDQPKGYSYSVFSENEPPDPNCFFRFGRFRLRRFEMALEVHLYN